MFRPPPPLAGPAGSLPDRIAQDAQVLVQIFQDICRIHAGQSAGSTRLVNVGTAYRHPHAGTTLAEQWATIQEECFQLEEQIGGFQTDINPFVETLSDIIADVVTGCTDLRSHEVNFPFNTLKILTVVRVSVTNYLDKARKVEAMSSVMEDDGTVTMESISRILSGVPVPDDDDDDGVDIDMDSESLVGSAADLDQRWPQNEWWEPTDPDGPVVESPILQSPGSVFLRSVNLPAPPEQPVKPHPPLAQASPKFLASGVELVPIKQFQEQMKQKDSKAAQLVQEHVLKSSASETESKSHHLPWFWDKKGHSASGSEKSSPRSIRSKDEPKPRDKVEGSSSKLKEKRESSKGSKEKLDNSKGSKEKLDSSKGSKEKLDSVDMARALFSSFYSRTSKVEDSEQAQRKLSKNPPAKGEGELGKAKSIESLLSESKASSPTHNISIEAHFESTPHLAADSTDVVGSHGNRLVPPSTPSPVTPDPTRHEHTHHDFHEQLQHIQQLFHHELKQKVAMPRSATNVTGDFERLSPSKEAHSETSLNLDSSAASRAEDNRAVADGLRRQVGSPRRSAAPAPASSGHSVGTERPSQESIVPAQISDMPVVHGVGSMSSLYRLAGLETPPTDSHSDASKHDVAMRSRLNSGSQSQQESLGRDDVLNEYVALAHHLLSHIEPGKVETSGESPPKGTIAQHKDAPAETSGLRSPFNPTSATKPAGKASSNVLPNTTTEGNIKPSKLRQLPDEQIHLYMAKEREATSNKAIRSVESHGPTEDQDKNTSLNASEALTSDGENVAIGLGGQLSVKNAAQMFEMKSAKISATIPRPVTPKRRAESREPSEGSTSASASASARDKESQSSAGFKAQGIMKSASAASQGIHGADSNEDQKSTEDLEQSHVTRKARSGSEVAVALGPITDIAEIKNQAKSALKETVVLLPNQEIPSKPADARLADVRIESGTLEFGIRSTVATLGDVSSNAKDDPGVGTSDRSEQQQLSLKQIPGARPGNEASHPPGVETVGLGAAIKPRDFFMPDRGDASAGIYMSERNQGDKDSDSESPDEPNSATLPHRHAHESSIASTIMRPNPFTSKVTNDPIGKLHSSSSLLSIFSSNDDLVADSPQIILLPLNNTFELCHLVLTTCFTLGRHNANNSQYFKVFKSQVVSRVHLQIWEKDGRVFIRDMGSNAGTFHNGTRISDVGQKSGDVEIKSGDYIQLGKDYCKEWDTSKGVPFIEPRHQCIKMQVIIVPNRRQMEALELLRSKAEENKLEDSGLAATALLKRLANETKKKEEEMRKRAASNESTLQGSPAKSEAASEPPRPVTRKHVSFMKVTQKQQFVIGVISSGTSGKVKKVQISTRTGASAVVVNLKKWETKRLLTIRDTRPQFSATEYLELYNSDFDINNPKTHSLYPARYVIQTAGVTIAHLEYVNQLKIQISPNYPGAPIYCCTGDFSLGKYIIIIKHPNSREQRFFGECGGRHLLKKSMMDSKVTYYLETEDCENSQLVLSAVCFIAAVTSSFN